MAHLGYIFDGQSEAATSHKQAVKTAVPLFFEEFQDVAKGIAKAAAKKTKPKLKAYTAASRAKWLDKYNKGDFECCEEFKPACLRIKVEKASLCLRVYRDNKRVKSFAWPSRGHAICMDECLRWCWGFVEDENPYSWLFDR